MVGRRSFPFGARPIFRGEMAVNFREGIPEACPTSTASSIGCLGQEISENWPWRPWRPWIHLDSKNDGHKDSCRWFPKKSRFWQTILEHVVVFWGAGFFFFLGGGVGGNVFRWSLGNLEAYSKLNVPCWFHVRIPTKTWLRLETRWVGPKPHGFANLANPNSRPIWPELEGSRWSLQGWGLYPPVFVRLNWGLFILNPDCWWWRKKSILLVRIA